MTQRLVVMDTSTKRLSASSVPYVPPPPEYSYDFIVPSEGQTEFILSNGVNSSQIVTVTLGSILQREKPSLMTGYKISSIPSNIGDAALFNGMVYFSAGSGIYTTLDNITVTKLAGVSLQSSESLFVDGTNLYAVGSQIISRSSDGAAFSTVYQNSTARVGPCITRHSGNILCPSSSVLGSMFYSPTGDSGTWLSASSPAYYCYSMASFGGYVYASFNDSTNRFMRSVTGIDGSWSVVTSPVPAAYKLATLNGYLYAQSTGGGIYRTSDGSNWTRVTRTGVEITRLSLFGSTLIARGSYGNIYSSTDGTTWICEAGFSPGQDVYAVATFNSSLLAYRWVNSSPSYVQALRLAPSDFYRDVANNKIVFTSLIPAESVVHIDTRG